MSQESPGVLPLREGGWCRAEECDTALVTGVRPNSGCTCRAAADGLAVAVGALARLVGCWPTATTPGTRYSTCGGGLRPSGWRPPARSARVWFPLSGEQSQLGDAL